MAVATSTILIGAAIGAAVGAVAGATVGGGGDAIWKGALVGAVGGAVTGGVGSWAGGFMGSTAAGALAGGAGGLTSGLLSTALNGGTGSDYLKSGLFGGLGGAALGAAGGALGGGATNGELAVDAQGIPTTADGAYAFDDAVAGSTVDPNTASSLSGGTVGQSGGTAVVDPTLAAPTSATTAPQLSDTVNNLANNQYAAANTGTMTDIGGSSAQPLELPGSYQASDTGNFRGLQMPTASNSGTGLDLTGNVGINPPDNALAPELTTDFGKQAVSDYSYTPKGEYSAETLMPGKEPPSMWDKFSKGFNMDGDLGKYLKMQGYGQLAGGAMKTLGAAATAPETAQNRRQLMDLYNTQMNQYNQQANVANKYQQQLQATYDNPESYLNTPEAVAARQQAMQKLLAQNAAAGRRTAGLATQNQLMMNQLSNLANYRRGLQGNIQYPNYSPAASTLNYAQQYSPTADIMGGLSSMFTPTSMYALSQSF